ncbi:MAG TPA: hypothetical protein VFY65_01425, partial [Longimicrobium sp.]|nr:hypothetical protein [Longimicrobium sp.]
AESPANRAGLHLLEGRTPKIAQDRVRAPRDVPVAWLPRVSASCAILESRFFAFEPSEADPRTHQVLRGARAPGVSLRRCRNGGLPEWYDPATRFSHRPALQLLCFDLRSVSCA